MNGNEIYEEWKNDKYNKEIANLMDDWFNEGFLFRKVIINTKDVICDDNKLSFIFIKNNKVIRFSTYELYGKYKSVFYEGIYDIEFIQLPDNILMLDVLKDNKHLNSIYFSSFSLSINDKFVS